MLRDTLKLEIDRLSEAQLNKLAELIEEIKAQPELEAASDLQEKEIAAVDQLQRFREWANHSPLTGISLPDEAFDRGNIYD